MESNIVAAVVAGLTAAGANAALLPMVFKGKLRHDREYLKLENDSKDRLAELKSTYEESRKEHEDTIDKLEAAKDRLEQELREQYKLNVEQDREMRETINWLRDMAGIAARDQRRQPRHNE